MSIVKTRDEMPEKGQYDIFATGAPEDFDPEAKGRVPLTPGWFLFAITDFVIAEDDEFKYKGDTCILDQLRPQLTVVEGPCTGATIMDFLPLPPRKGQKMPLTQIANQWAQFARCAGFTMSQDTMMPAEWLSAIQEQANPYDTMIDRRLYGRLIPQVDQDGEPKCGKDGQQFMRVAYFGYRSEAEGPLEPASASTAAQTPRKSGSRGKPPTTAANIQL